jgi:hypothetical protein
MMSSVSLEWRRAAIRCVSTLRNLQYYLPAQIPSEEEARLMWANRNYFIGHPLWLLQLVKIVKWNSADESQELFRLLETTYLIAKDPTKTAHLKLVDHWLVMCSSMCKKFQGKFQPHHGLELLGENVLHPEIRKLGLRILNRAHNSELLCFIPMLVFYIRYEPSLPNISLLFLFLLRKSMQDAEIRTALYWELKVQSECPKFG